jgi:phosphoribosylanthranilate isomerase
VDVCSGVETSPGRKSFQLMRDFVAAVRTTNAER